MKLSVILVLLLLYAPGQAQEDRIAALKQKLKNIDSSKAGELLEQARHESDTAVRRAEIRQ